MYFILYVCFLLLFYSFFSISLARISYVCLESHTIGCLTLLTMMILLRCVVPCECVAVVYSIYVCMSWSLCFTIFVHITLSFVAIASHYFNKITTHTHTHARTIVFGATWRNKENDRERKRERARWRWSDTVRTIVRPERKNMWNYAVARLI